MPEFVGALTEDIALLSNETPPPAVAESNGLPEASLHSDDGGSFWNPSDLTPEQILSDDLQVFTVDENGKPRNSENDEETVTLEPIEEPEEVEAGSQDEPKQAKPSADDILLNNNFWTARESQGYEQPSQQEQLTLTESAMRGFFRDKIMEKLPGLKDVEASERQAFIDGRYRELFKAIAADKPFIAKLDKIYNGSQESIERSGNLFIQRAANILPRLLSNFTPPKITKGPATKPLTQSEANGMSFKDILNSMRPREKNPKWVPHMEAFQ